LSNDGASAVMVGWNDEQTLRSWLRVFAGEFTAGIAGTIGRSCPCPVTIH
jgi:hypothetical protein